MDTIDHESLPEEHDAPRPLWQVHMARIGLILFVLFVIYQILQIAGGWQ